MVLRTLSMVLWAHFMIVDLDRHNIKTLGHVGDATKALSIYDHHYGSCIIRGMKTPPEETFVKRKR
jgi:hypothetical protein